LSVTKALLKISLLSTIAFFSINTFCAKKLLFLIIAKSFIITLPQILESKTRALSSTLALSATTESLSIQQFPFCDRLLSDETQPPSSPFFTI